jgi:hypothetical protein
MITPDFAAMTPLEIFDYGVAKIVEQGRASIGPDPRNQRVGTCRLYHGPDNCRCGAGFFIPDDKYLARMEGESFGPVARQYDIGWTPTQMQLVAISYLQRAHDGAASDGDNFIESFKRVTNQLRGLVHPV